MNILIDRIINCLHWLDMFFPGKQDKIDWKEVGQMRHRLVSMRFAYQAAGGSIDPIVPVAGTVAVAEPGKSSNEWFDALFIPRYEWQIA